MSTKRKSPPPPAKTKTSVWGKIGLGLRIAGHFLRHLPILGFIAQHWLLIAIFALVAILVLFNVFYSVAGVFIWTLALVLGAQVAAVFLRNVFNRQTTDADCDSGWFVENWQKLDRDRRVTLIVVERLVYFLGACIALGFLANR